LVKHKLEVLESTSYYFVCGLIAQWLDCNNCEVEGSILGSNILPPGNNSGQVVHITRSSSTKQYSVVSAKRQ